MSPSPSSPQEGPRGGTPRHRYYPVLLDLRHRPAVVVGGGELALEKVRPLLEAGACVTVIAPERCPPLAELATDSIGTGGRLRHLARDYRRGDLAGACLAVSTLAESALNQVFWEEARALRIPANVLDDPPRCGFIFPSVLRRGDLTVAISTSGSAPALAVRLRQRLEGQLGPEHERFLDLARRSRAPLAARLPDLGARRTLWYRLVDSDALDLLAGGDDEAAALRFEEILGVRPVDVDSSAAEGR